MPTAKPGIIPLRPLTIGEILAAAITVVRRHFLALAGVSLTVSVIGALATWAILAGSGQVHEFVTGSWLDGVLNRPTVNIPGGVLAATVLSLVISLIGGVLVAGMATVCAAQDTLGRPTTGADWRDRLGRTWPVLLALSVVVAVLVGAGLLLFIIPGVLVYLGWLVATPVAVMERSGIARSLRRSAVLTTGERGRLLGLVAAVLVVTVLLTTFVTSLLGDVFNQRSPTGALLISEGISCLLGMITGSWAGAVSALAYIDLRIRKENLAPTLAAAATR
ncbi:MAG: hypothetical protein M3Y77_04670 [Actinomycetota bacterium]|nr:hypothetical protein [Actinomycetota bacterium]